MSKENYEYTNISFELPEKIYNEAKQYPYNPRGGKNKRIRNLINANNIDIPGRLFLEKGQIIVISINDMRKISLTDNYLLLKILHSHSDFNGIHIRIDNDRKKDCAYIRLYGPHEGASITHYYDGTLLLTEKEVLKEIEGK